MKNTSHEALHLSDLLVARLCHDLISPLSAVTAGFELLQDTPTADTSEILELISHSATVASLRASFFRAAFAGRLPMSFQETLSLVEKYAAYANLSLTWKNGNEIPPDWMRLLLNALFCLHLCAPRGGDLTIEWASEGSLSFTLTATSLIISDETRQAFEGKGSFEEMTPQTVPYFLASLLAREKNVRCSLSSIEKSSLSLRVH